MARKKITRICSVENCGSQVGSKGFCVKHANQERYRSRVGLYVDGKFVDRRYLSKPQGSGYKPIRLESAKDIARFWSKVDRSSGQGPKGDCWEWKGTPSSKGYGHFGIGVEVYKAHRIAWQLANDCDVTDGLFILHSCDNRLCCNPEHLREGTHVENMRDMVLRGRSTKNRKEPEYDFCYGAMPQW